jgi:hypothetical protein
MNLINGKGTVFYTACHYCGDETTNDMGICQKCINELLEGNKDTRFTG